MVTSEARALLREAEAVLHADDVRDGARAGELLASTLQTPMVGSCLRAGGRRARPPTPRSGRRRRRRGAGRGRCARGRAAEAPLAGRAGATRAGSRPPTRGARAGGSLPSLRRGGRRRGAAPSAQQSLGGVGPVRVRGVEELDPELGRAAQQRAGPAGSDGSPQVPRPGERHRPEAEAPDREVSPSRLSAGGASSEPSPGPAAGGGKGPRSARRSRRASTRPRRGAADPRGSGA